MASQDDRVSRATDAVSIALLRRLRAGAEIPYVHRADVCSAAPADLVTNLTPAPGSHQTQDGYKSIWYFYCSKRYKNTRGKASGYRERGIGTGGETRWHKEVRAKDVHGSEGGTFCTFSYGRMENGSLERLGWCMVEYDFVDNQAAANTAASNYVLCKVYRSSRAKGKQPSSSSKSATSSSSSRKRKAGSGNPKARPTKLIRVQREQVQMQHDNTFTNNYPMPSYEHQHMDHAMFGHEEVHALQQPHASAPEHYGEFVQTKYGPMSSQLAHINVDEWIGCQEMFGGEEEHGLQQQRSAEKEQTGEFVQIPCGLVVPVAAELTVEDLLGPAETMSSECIGMTTAGVSLDDDFFVGVDPECLFGAQEEARSRASSSHAPSWSMVPSSSTCPVEPVVTEVTVEDLFGPEMMSGERGSMPTANTPPDDDFFVGVDPKFGAQENARSRASSSHAPSWSMAPSSSAGCSILVQEPPLWLPYLMCS